ncbi:MAG: SUMF1/EgtB/PvdO family nonheme iron enzyme, partial [Thermodesulfobacteriota bacterium]
MAPGFDDRAESKGVSRGSNRVIRGGSWNNDPWNLRSAIRNNNGPDNRNNNLGLRLVLPQLGEEAGGPRRT